jgi:four helix bundle protein
VVVSARARTRDFRSLKVWERAHQLTLGVYRSTGSFPREELFGLTSQARRATQSVPANIAEGCGRGGGDLPRFCRIAPGSASELQYHLLLARDLDYLDESSYQALSNQTSEVERMLHSFIARVTEEDS